MNNMYDILNRMNLLEGKGSKPDFPDIDNDGNRTEPISKAAKEVDEASYSAKAARAGKDIGKPGKNFEKIAKSAGERYGSKERGEKVAGAVLAKLRAKESIDEADMEEGNEFSGELAKAKATGAKEFEVDGKTYPVKESSRSKKVQDIRLVKEAQRGDRKVQIYHDSKYDEFTVCLSHDGHTHKIFAESSNEAAAAARSWLAESGSQVNEGYFDFMDKKAQYAKIGAEVEGKADDYTVTFKDGSRKRHQEMDGRRRVTTLEPVDAPEETDDEGNVVKRGRGRPKGSKRSLGAKGPSGRSKLMRMEEDYDKDEYDEEGEMAKSQARTIEDAAQELQDILDDDENLPEWVQKKIVLAKEYIDSARDYMKANPDEEEVDVDVEVDDEELVAEKAVSKAQRAAAGIAYAAKKGDIPKSELRGASKEMAKMPSGELKKFAKTKEKGLPEKKDEAVEETTTSGSVATAPSSNKATGIFGKGVYEAKLAESFEQKIKTVMTESVNVTVNANSEGSNTVTVTGQDVAPDTLMDLLKMAGMGGAPEEVYKPVQAAPADMMSGMLDTLDGIAGEEEAIPEAAVCEVCGGHEGMHEAGCSREMAMEADLANSADNTETMSTDYMVNQLAGGLNGPKTQVNPNNPGDNPLAMPGLGKTAHSLNLGAVAEDVEQQLENRLMDLYKRIS